MFHASPPPYLTLDQEDYYDDQYESRDINANPLSRAWKLLTCGHRIDLLS